MNDSSFLLIITIVFIASVYIYGRCSRIKAERLLKTTIREGFGNAPSRKYKDGEFAHIKGYARNHQKPFFIDDITWKDLNMDDIFKSMNYTYSSAGEEYLFYLLKNPSLEDNDFEGLEREIAVLEGDEKLRNDLAYALNDCGRTGKYSIYDYLGNLELLKGENAKHDMGIIAGYCLAIPIMFFSVSGGITLLALMCVYSIMTYFSKKRKIEAFIICFSYVFRLLRGCNILFSLKDRGIFVKELEELQKVYSRFGAFKRFSFILVSSQSSNPLDIIIEYIKMLFHLDIIKFFQMLKELEARWEDIDSILTIMGKIDATLSICMYRAYSRDYGIPILEECSEPVYETAGLFHPLLDEPVKNDVNLKKGMLLTGSNASGKSTMLKTIAVNAIMAQSVHTVCSDTYRASYFRIYTSLALSDNIFKGESYYMSEIHSLKRILDRGKEANCPILVCVDEVLRGTNTIERISAGSCILRTLSEVNGFIIAATHDLELTELLEDCYDNYHFEEEIKGEDIAFCYKLLPGRATTRNAIRLLRVAGYDENIVDKAEELAGRLDKARGRDRIIG